MKARAELKNIKTGQVTIVEAEIMHITPGGDHLIADAQLAYLTSGNRVEHSTLERMTVLDGEKVVTTAERRFHEKFNMMMLCEIN